MCDSEVKRFNVLVLSTTYPINRQDISAIFLQSLYQKCCENFCDCRVVCANPNHKNVEVKGKIGQWLEIVRVNYFFPKMQLLFYRDAVVSNLHHNKMLYLLIPFYLTALLFTSCLEIKRKRPDLIHAHWAIPCGLVGVLLKKLFKLPMLVTSHGGDVYSFKNRTWRGLLQFVYKNADIINPVSEPLKEEILSLDGRLSTKIRVISMGVDNSNFYYIKEARQQLGYSKEDRIVLFVGRLSENKGVSYLIDAIRLLIKKELTGLKVLIIGDGNLRMVLQQQVKDNKLKEFISFLGTVPNDKLPLYYSAADALVIPSIPDVGGKEGMPVTLMEGLACGCNIVASKTGGLSTLNHRRVTLVEPRNSGQLSTAIELALNKQKGVAESRNSRFSLETVSQEFLKVYSLLAESKNET